MADRPYSLLDFNEGSCSDCARRVAVMPPPVLKLDKELNTRARDFDSIVEYMLGILRESDPERAKFSQADSEVILVEALAAALDRSSHALDVAFAERFLSTANWPSSIVRILALIDGVDDALLAVKAHLNSTEIARLGLNDEAQPAQIVLFNILTARPFLKPLAKAAGLENVTKGYSCISVENLREKLQQCPIVSQALCLHKIGAGEVIYEATIWLTDSRLNLMSQVDALGDAFVQFEDYINRAERILSYDDLIPMINTGDSETQLRESTIRTALYRVVAPLMPQNSTLRLLDGRRAGVYMRLCVEVDANYYRSEVELAVRERLSAKAGGFFDPRNFETGEALYISDIHETLMALNGVRGVIISALRLVGDGSTQALTDGHLSAPANTTLILDNENSDARTGYYLLRLSGGMIG